MTNGTKQSIAEIKLPQFYSALRFKDGESRSALTAGRGQSFIMAAFLVGWASYAFTLFDVGRFSITLILLASVALTILALRSQFHFSAASICLLTSGLLAGVVSVLSYYELEKTITHLIQCLLAIGVMIGAQSINWNSVLPRFRRCLFWVSAIVLAYAMYQFVARQYGLPFDYLLMTNQQIASVDRGFQRGAILAIEGSGRFMRVSSFFAEPSDLGRFMLWVFAVGYGCTRRRTQSLLIAMGIAGIVISQSMGAAVGLVFLLVLMMLLKRNFCRAVLLLLVGSVVLASLFYFFPQAFYTLEERAEMIVALRGEYLLEGGRFAYIADNLRLCLQAPFLGHGIASYLKVASYNVMGSSLMLLLLERGLIGSGLFLAPFLWAFFHLGLSRSARSETAQTALGVLVVEIYCLTTFCALYFQPLYLALGFALWCLPRRIKSKQVATNSGRVIGGISSTGREVMRVSSGTNKYMVERYIESFR